MERALSFERDRQIAAMERGEAIEQRTMLFDAASGEVRPTRSKEESHDYRYFPEPMQPSVSAQKPALTGGSPAPLPATEPPCVAATL